MTGGYSGIGTAVTRGLSDAGATVVVPARHPDQARKVIGGVAGVDIAELDLADLGSVERFAGDFLSQRSRPERTPRSVRHKDLEFFSRTKSW